MSEVHIGEGARGGANENGGNAAATLGAVDLLCLAAAPTFAIMALLTVVLGGGQMSMICSTQDASPLSGMVPMYLLMSVFHSAPWLRMVSNYRGGVRRS